MTHTCSASLTIARAPCIADARVRRDLAPADLQHGFKLGELGFVLIGVVLAEEKLSSGR